MPTKKTATPVKPPVVGPSAVLIAKARKEGLAIVPPLQQEIAALDITDEESYQAADELLGRVSRARKTWAGKMAPIIDPLKDAVRSAKLAQKGADELFKEVDAPLERLDSRIRGAMAAYKIEEKRLIDAANQKQQDIQEDINEAAEVEAYGRTSTVRQKATATREYLEQKQAEAFEAAPVAAQAEGSGTRFTRKVRVVDPAKFLLYIAKNYETLADCVEVRQPRLNQWLKEDEEGIKSWPGIEVYDDVTIVKR